MKDKYTEIIETVHGPIRGFLENNTQNFLGIPYATPPTGDLRWRPPESPRGWTKPLDAVAFGPTCAQRSACFPGFASDSSTEDCLYLNVVAPYTASTTSKRKLPVMVFIHGGGFCSGASNDYDGKALVNNGNIIFVSLNYRVGIFGFFSHPSINQEGDRRGNFGIMDQQLALSWVQQNISNFGGDKFNVTVFGESAGGASILAHIAAPSSRGLFHKAIVQSGGSPPTLIFPTIETLEELGIAFATAAGCKEQNAQTLRNISTEAVLTANELEKGAFGVGKYPFGLMEDGNIVPKKLREAFSTGKISRLPMLIGSNRDEFTWFQAMMELRSGRVISAEAFSETVVNTIEMLNKLHLNGLRIPLDEVPRILEMYPLEAFVSPSRALAAIVGDGGLISTAGRRTARVLADHCPCVYVYEFDVPDTPCPWPQVSFPYGSAHTLELPYIFPRFCGGTGKVTPLSNVQQRLATEMVFYWTNFAWHSTPNNVSSALNDSTAMERSILPDWEPYEAEKDNVMLLQASDSVHMINDWGQRHNSDYWDSFY